MADRLIPEGGVIISGYDTDHLCRYMDLNDVDFKFWLPFMESVRAEKALLANTQEGIAMTKLTKGTVGRRFVVYTYLESNSELIGYSHITERLDNPYGFGAGDFLFERWYTNDYRHTKYVRFVYIDIISLMFMSGIANHVYGYSLTTKTSTDGGLLPQDATLNTFCAAGATEVAFEWKPTQTFLSIKEIISYPEGSFALVVTDGEIFRKLDLREFAKGLYGVDDKIIDARLLSLENAASKMKELVK